MRNIITLLTDFGNEDGYVGIMKGVILSINPHAQIVDITHQIPRHNIEAGAFILNNSYQFFPSETIHVAIVDPGVGGIRRAIVVQTKNYFFIAPDNQILKYIFYTENEFKVFEISNQKYFLKKISHTFHGRDIFAPAAAHLSSNIKIEELGQQISDIDYGNIALPIVTYDYIKGQIIYSDRFGNLITNIPATLIQNYRICIKINGINITKLSRSYFDSKDSSPIALIGSSGFLEIAIFQQSAKGKLCLKEGDEIKIIKRKNAIPTT